MSKREILQVPLSKIDQIVNSRVTYDDAEMAELMTSMRHRGLLGPIGLRKGKDGRYEVSFGNRRFIAAQKLGWETIDAVLSSAKDENELLIENAVENMQRADVAFAEQGRTFYVLTKKGLTPGQIAARVGISEKKVKQILHVYDLIPEDMRAKIVTGVPGQRLKGGQIPSSTASMVIDIAARSKLPEGQRRQLLKLAGKDGMTGLHIRRLGTLLRSGLSLEQASKAMEATKIITIQVAIPFSKIKKLEDDYGIEIHNIIFNTLKREKWLGIIHSIVTAPKKEKEKKASAG